jgi:hypothetical protein
MARLSRGLRSQLRHQRPRQRKRAAVAIERLQSATATRSIRRGQAAIRPGGSLPYDRQQGTEARGDAGADNAFNCL